MKTKRLLLALAMILSTLLAYGGDCEWTPSLKYAGWLPAFSIDNAWEFSRTFSDEGNHTSYGEHPLDETSMVRYPGVISWAMMSWDEKTEHSDDHNMDWAYIYIFNGNDPDDEIQLCKIIPEGSILYGNDNGWRLDTIYDKNGNHTYLASEAFRSYEDGSGFLYFITYYTDEVRQLIQRSNGNVKVRFLTSWDACKSSWKEYNKTSALDSADQQLIPVPTQPTISNVGWTVYDNATCVAFDHGVTMTGNWKMNVREDDVIALSNVPFTASTGYYHASDLANRSQQMNTYGFMTLNAYISDTYSYNNANYSDTYCDGRGTTVTLYSSGTSFSPLPFAQPRDLSVANNENGTTSLTWFVDATTSGVWPDNSPFIIERATDSRFTTEYSTDTVQYNNSQTRYTFLDSFPNRSQDNVTFHYRVHRQNAEASELNSKSQLSVNTNYSTLDKFEAVVDTAANAINLQWNFNQGLRNPEMIVHITYGGTTLDIPSDSATHYNGIITTECDEVLFQAQLYVNESPYSTQKSAVATRPYSLPFIIDTLIVSAGYYMDHVNLNWSIADESSDFSYFVVKRSEYNSSNPSDETMTSVQFTTGVRDYSYVDNTCIPGVYYEYTVIGYSDCGGSIVRVSDKSAIGFAQPYGVVSGQITYSGNQAVQDVAVVAECDNQYGGKSLSFIGSRQPTLQMQNSYLRQFASQNDGTAEMYVRVNDVMAHNPILYIGNFFMLDAENDKLILKALDANGTTHSVEASGTLAGGAFFHTALTFTTKNSQRTFTLYMNGDSVASLTVSLPDISQMSTSNALRFGHDGNGNYMTGNLDEIRFWTTRRSQQEIQRYMNIYLNGEEQGLGAYYRCDDDVTRMIFDLSKTGNNFNNRHLYMTNVTIDELNIPTVDQLGHKAYTDQNGNYLFNNLPYSNQGTLYNIIPTLGIHEFSPSSSPLYFNASANTHNSVNFEDVSSFPVSGRVTFFNTNYPVQGCQFYVDGTSLCTYNGEPVESDENGEYLIEVPIGQHYITVKKGSHYFANNGRYPADPHNTGTKYEFQNAITNLAFQDSTFMLVTGRVSGGSDEAEKKHGFAKGKATIGQARITLGTHGDLYNLNTDENNGRTFTMPADSIHGTCRSVSTTGRAYQNLAHTITILTDSITGEFNVMLPPIDYEVRSAEIVNNDGYISFNLSSTGDIALSEKEVTSTTTDSILDYSGNYIYFSYSAALDLIHYTEPVMSLTQNDGNKALGSSKYYYKDDITGFKDTIPLYSIDQQGNVTYTFGHPCYMKNDIGTWTLSAYESYVNYDNRQHPDTTKQPFRYGVVAVSNNFAQQLKNTASLTDTSVVISDGNVASVSGNELMLDGDGTTYYSFKVGDPNILPPYTASFSLSYQDAERTRYYDWDPDVDNEGIVLGSAVTGANFVSKGPDEVFYILRDPVGADSYAEWEAGNTVTKTVVEKISGSWHENMTTLVIFGHKSTTVAAPMGAGTTIDAIDMDNKDGIFEEYSNSHEYTDTRTWVFTNSTTISTSADHDMVGSEADVFIGYGTNQLFGNANEVYVKRDTAGNYSIDQQNVISVESEFSTQFNYTQKYVVTSLIPNLKMMRNSLLTQVPASQYDTSFVNYSDDPIYITTLSSSDSLFGTNGTYLMIYPESWKLNPYDKRIFSDEVYDYNLQIQRWIDELTHNERCKVTVHNSTKPFDRQQWEQAVYGVSDEIFQNLYGPAIDSTYSVWDRLHSSYKGGWLLQNYSLGTGSSMSCSETREYSSVSNGKSTSNGYQFGAKGENSTTIASIGVEFEWELISGDTWTDESSTENGESSRVSYTIPMTSGEALTFDVYQSPDGFGPIFYEKGGQTLCPYQDVEYTQYYEPGEHELQAATTPLATARITVDNPVVSNIPVGKKAIFNIDLANAASPGMATSFLLRQDATSNPNGAILRIDGQVIGEQGVLFNLGEAQSISKVVELEQTRADILDYDSIILIFQPECSDLEASEVLVSAHFVQTCSDITFTSDRTILNNTTGNTIQFTINGFEQDFRNLAGIQLQYRGEGDDQWHLVEQFPADSVANINHNFSFTKPSYPDGNYEFRAVTLCQFGTETVNNESDVIHVVVDMAAPEALGQPYPLDGIYTSNNQVYVDFSEPIQPGRVLSDNVTVEGVLNAHQVDHAISLSLDNNTAASSANFTLGTTSFTLELWLNYSQPGTIFKYAMGSTNNMVLGIDTNNHLTLSVGNSQITSAETMLTDRWLYLVARYDSSNSQFSASYAYDDQIVDIILPQGINQPALSGTISFGGNGFVGNVHDAVLWKRARSMSESLAERSESKSTYTPDIISLWYMNEGKGRIANDYVRRRNLTLTDDSWAYNHENYAMHVAAGDSAVVDITRCPIETGKSYLFEFWFRANGDVELVHASDPSLAISIISGNLVANGHYMPIRNYMDNAWHHFALINQKLSTPVVAIDGVQLSSLSLTALPPITFGSFIFGGSNTNDLDIDEFRLWNINTNLQAVRQLMGTCLTGDEPGLVAYYPMEDYITDPITNQISTEFRLTDKTDETRTRMINHSDSLNAQAATAPALVESRPTEYVSHTNTASSNRIMVNITESPERIEGCQLEITVKDIVDLNGNYSEPIRWTVFVNRNQLLWDNNTFSIVKDETADTTISLLIVNNSSVVQNWSVTNIPSCMSFSESSGYIQPMQTKNITCTIDATADHGENEYVLYLSGNENMETPLYITTKVYANKPDWTIDPSQFENSMNIIAYAEISGVMADDPEDMLAAFVDGELSGVTNLQLLQSMGRYYAIMTIFQNNNTYSNPRNITFRFWDASAGVIYSNAKLYTVVNDSVCVPFGDLIYKDNVVVGDFVNPLRLVMGNEIEQSIDLINGWNWISFNVEPANNSFSDILNPYLNDFIIIKSQTGYAVPDTAASKVRGNIGSMICTNGYKIKTSTPFELQVTGFATKVSAIINFTAQQWTWFGFLPQKAMTINAAMSNINPSVGDIVKSQTQFSAWDGYQWVGSLNVMMPGHSYVYKNVGSKGISFTFPDYADITYMMPSATEGVADYFEPVNPGLYQGNMNITAVVRYSGQEVTDAEVGIFAGTECRAAATYDDGYYFITVPGDSTLTLTVKVFYNDSLYTMTETIQYQNDAVIGTLADPYVIDLNYSPVTGVDAVPTDADRRKDVQKVLIDNEVFIIRDGKMYDMHGRPRE